MNSRFLQALNIQKGKIEPYNPLIAGTLGIIMGGQQLVEVPDRPSYVYVMVRSSTEEVIQAFNQQVAPVYGLPVFIQWQGNRYVVVERDTMRYSNWQDFSPYLPRHASTHEFRGSAGDVVFVDQQQFLPLMPMPSGAFGNKEIVINDYNLMTTTGTFQYSPIQITKDLTVWNPTSSTGAQMVLVSMDMTNGGLNYTVGSGSVFSNQLTGTADVLPNIPAVSDISRYLPIAAVRLVTGTSLLTWQNIYDVRPIFGATSVNQGGGGGGGGGSSSGVAILNNGVLENYANQLNLLGAGFTLFHSGTEADLTIQGGSGPSGALLLNTSNGPLTGPLVIYQQFPNNLNQYLDWSTLVAYLSGTQNNFVGAAGEFVNWSTGNNTNAVFIDDEAGGGPSLNVLDIGLMNKTTFEIDKYIDTFRRGGTYSSPMVLWNRDGNRSTAYTPGASVLVINQIDPDLDHSPSIELDVSYSNLTYLWPNHSGSPFILPIPNYAPYHFDTAANIPTGMVIMQVLNNNLPKFWVGNSGYVEAAGGFNTRYGTYDINGVPHTHTGIGGGGTFTGPFPQPVFGIYGESAGVPLGSGTILNVRGPVTTFTISGTTLDLFVTGTPGAQGPSGSPGSPGPQGATGATGPQGPAGAGGGFGIFGEAAGVPLGTGTIFNVRGSNSAFTISGTTLDLFVTGSSGGGITLDQADPYGIFHRITGSNADDDEFSSDTSANYTAVNPTGLVTWAIGDHVLSAVFSGQSANDLGAFLKAITLADGESFETILHILSAPVSYSMAGIVITNGTLATSSAIAVLIYSDVSGAISVQLWKGTLTNMNTNSNSITVAVGQKLAGFRVRLKRTSSTSFNWLLSTEDGAQFNAFGTTGADPGFTPTHAGVFVSVWGGTHTAMASFDFIRHMS